MIPDLLAKGIAVAVAALLTIVVAVLVVTSRPAAGGTQVVAEFDDAFPLIEGMFVRVDGAIAGTVGRIEVNERGNAEVDLNLSESIEPPMSDANAAIRQQDTTGDSYVAYDPGDSDEPLGDDGIVCESHDRCDRTLVAPRLDDLLNAFGPSERTGVQLVLVELSKALDRRGRDLNEAALALKPGIELANQALAEVQSQNRALGELIASAESVTGQAASRRRELGLLVDSLAATVDATAAQSAALDAGLERLPETTTSARTVLAELTTTALRARPLADELAAGAPQLATALDRAPGFIDDADSFLADTRPTLELTRKLLNDAEPTLKVGKRRVVTGPFDLTGATADLLNAVLGGEDAFPALFDDDSYGEGEGTLGKRGFGAVAVEPGNLPGYPESHFPRRWLRVSAVINCEVFGVPVEPGCLADVLSGGLPVRGGTGGDGRARSARSLRDAIGGRESGGGGARSGLPGGSDRDRPGGGDGSGGKGGRGKGGSGGGKGGRSKGGRDGIDLPNLPDLGRLGPSLGGQRGAGKASAGGKSGLRRGSGAAGDLFDFLLRNR